ncbi:MAG: T9SS type A sorting domain-containing protein [Bacteroidales bacterium]|jgi:hypothetical protein|nr:T9SS type A sorting domain-containing protein [Bacteroidales bacterium]
MRNIYIIILAFISISLNAQQISKVNRAAFDSLYRYTGGDNWEVKNMDELASRQTNPRILLMPWGSSIKVVKEYHITFNNMSGDIPKSFFHPALDNSEPQIEAMSHKVVNFAHNNISSISPHFAYGKYKLYGLTKLDISHNKLKEFNAIIDKDHIGENQGLYTLDISFNDITKLNENSFNDNMFRYSCLSHNIDTLNVSNNHISFTDLLSVKKHFDRRIAALYFTAEPKSHTFIYAPQKAMGTKPDAVTVNKGESHTLNFKLPHPENRYQWELNGTDIPGATSPELTIADFNKDVAGYYRCKVTNSKLPELIHYSHNFPVLINGDKTIKDFDLSQKEVAAKLFSGAVVGIFTPEEGMYYQLTDKKENESFRIINGNILTTTEKLFKYQSIETYEIEVEKVNKHGQSLVKTFTISRTPGSSDIINVAKFSNNFKTIPENSETEVGNITLLGEVDGLLKPIDDYTIELPAGKMNNYMFTLNGTTLISKSINYEELPVCSIYVVAKHKTEDIKFIGIMKVIVKDVNDTPSDIILSDNTITIGNNTGDIIGFLNTIDEDKNSGDNTYTTFGSENGNKYIIVDNNIVRARSRFNNEKEFKIGIKATDTEGIEFTKTFRIIVTSNSTTTNTPPTDIGLSNAIIDKEWKAGNPVAILFMKDKDAGFGTFALKEGGDNNLFTIDNQILILKEDLPSDKYIFELEITATDTEGESITKTRYLYILDGKNAAISEQKPGNNIDIYPNPATNNIYLDIDISELKGADIKIYSTSGRLMISKALTNNYVDISTLKNGSYIITIEATNTSYTTRFIKQ